MNTFGLAVAFLIEDTIHGGTFYFQTVIYGVKMGGVGDFFAFFGEALASGVTGHFRMLSLHFDCGAAAAVVLIAGTMSCITGEFGHKRTFFPLMIFG